MASSVQLQVILRVDPKDARVSLLVDRWPPLILSVGVGDVELTPSTANSMDVRRSGEDLVTNISQYSH